MGKQIRDNRNGYGLSRITILRTPGLLPFASLADWQSTQVKSTQGEADKSRQVKPGQEY